MAERRRYPARDLVRARRKLRVECEELAGRGLRPAWMVWVPRPGGWWRLRRGELVVQFESLGADRRPGASLGPLLQPLFWRLQQLLANQAEVQRVVASVDAEMPGDLARTRRRLEASLREVELELTRLESLPEPSQGGARVEVEVGLDQSSDRS